MIRSWIKRWKKYRNLRSKEFSMTSTYEFPVAESVEARRKQEENQEETETRLRALEWPLQAGWFQYRIRNLNVSEIEALARQIANNDSSEIRRDYILKGSLDIKKDAIIADIVDPDGSLKENMGTERQWFRAEMNKQPLNERFRKSLELIETDPESEEAFAEIDAYFRESIQTH